uniref:ARAD1B17204p n=1 Tax=Blastobotrys adeninivorans TaxID=409370 RepID=A0A060T753_BLAAD
MDPPSIVRSTTDLVEPIEVSPAAPRHHRVSKLLSGLDKLKLSKKSREGSKSPGPPQSPSIDITGPDPDVPQSPALLLPAVSGDGAPSPSLELPPGSPSTSKRHSLRVFRSRSNSHASQSSAYVPTDLTAEEDSEKRAQLLALRPSPSPAPSLSPQPSFEDVSKAASEAIRSRQIDDQIQKAIDTYEAGRMEEAVDLFRPLADSHPLAQVMYGMCLRHGWGCAKDEGAGFQYLRMAASTSALVDLENVKLARGELVLAIYELGNCFRYGWGCDKDPYAALVYFETAANMGDLDAMISAAWCHETGFGTKKDKRAAAQMYRKAEDKGRKEVGNSWIWKPKYD